VDSQRSFGESSSSDEVLKGLLSKHIRFYTLIPLQLIQIPMIQGSLELDKIPPIHKLVLGDALHAFKRREYFERHKKGKNYIDDALKDL
jgi:hypothetical protein